MTRYIENLNECTDPTTGDFLWVVDASAGSTDKDRKVNISKFGLVSSGTWTPTLVGAGGNPTYTGTAIEGSWYRVGNLVFVRALISLSTYSGGTGALSIGALPFAAANTNYGAIPLIGINVAYGSGNTLLYARVTPVSTEMALIATGSGVGATFLQVGALTGSSALVLSGSYLA